LSIQQNFTRSSIYGFALLITVRLVTNTQVSLSIRVTSSRSATYSRNYASTREAPPLYHSNATSTDSLLNPLLSNQAPPTLPRQLIWVHRQPKRCYMEIAGWRRRPEIAKPSELKVGYRLKKVYGTKLSRCGNRGFLWICSATHL
jgi:hypothetical protein